MGNVKGSEWFEEQKQRGKNQNHAPSFTDVGRPLGASENRARLHIREQRGQGATETQKRNIIEYQIGPRSNESFEISALIRIIGWGQTHQGLSCALLEKDHHKFRTSELVV